MLAWWQERLRRDSLLAPHQMLFVDPRWVDMVPGNFEHTILRDPGYNVAYWNLDTRELARVGDRITAAGRPLRFFHFSGYDPSKPWVLAMYVVVIPRATISESAVV